jgi:DUF971 family protein
MRPTTIKKISKTELKITWDNGHESTYTLQHLRDICPCASCAGETVILHEYKPQAPDRSTPGRYELAGIQQVGSYAIQLQWGDGHNTGIYSWEHLIANCPCEVHLKA